MIRDENWYDAVGKDLWRWEQELAEMARTNTETNKPVELTNGIHTTHELPKVRKQG